MKKHILVLGLVAGYSQLALAEGTVALSSDEGVAPDTTFEGQSSVPPRSEQTPQSTLDAYMVKQGDTLWTISGRYAGSAWQWPRVWSYNPQITNPHWIYPDDMVRLVPGDGSMALGPSGLETKQGARSAKGAKKNLIRGPGWTAGEVILRDEAFLDRDAMRASGVIVGAPEEHMILTTYDHVYMRFDDTPADLAPGALFTIFREIPDASRALGEKGTLVRILGDIKVEEIDKKHNTVKGVIIESLDPIERGFRVGPIMRKFRMFPPRVNEKDNEMSVVATLRSIQLSGVHDMVFVDAGRDKGVQPGNRLLVLRSGDPWRSGLVTKEALMGSEGDHARTSGYPDETVAELTVVDVKATTATCVISGAVRPVELGDRVVMRAGY